MRRSRIGLPVVAAIATALVAAGCNDSGSHAAGTAASASPGLLNGTVTLAADQPLSSTAQQQVLTVLRARLAALHIDAVVTLTGDRAVRLRVPASAENVVSQLGAKGTFEVRVVETSGPKGQPAQPAPGAVPAAVSSSAGKCAVTSPGATQGWTVACDAAQKESYQLWPAELSNADVTGASEAPNTSQQQSAGLWSVNVSFTAAGQRRFFLATQRSLGLQIALVVDGAVQSAPFVSSAVNGDAQITGTMTQPQALLLATLIGNGALPVTLRAEGSSAG
jgi:preprotein translocase subunit SecD